MSGLAGAPHGVETLTLAGPSGDGWWPRYEAALAKSGITSTGREVIALDSEYIVDHGVYGAGDPGDPRWPDGRVRTGAVMGAIQSGKTASMMALVAKAIDRGTDVVVILAGTRTALWLQTIDRVSRQLDTGPSPFTRRVLLPSPRSVQGGEIAALSGLYNLTPTLAEKSLAAGRPVIAVVMKQADHLERLGSTLRDVFFPAAERLGKPVHLLVIDDEADDASVDGAVQTDEGASARTKQIPRRILDLWAPRHDATSTVASHVFATYVAYTATPQATFLQDDANPLAPRDFVCCLRTPGSDGGIEDRSATFREPLGAAAWYTGGDTYYRTLSAVPLCVTDTTDLPDDDLVIDAVRAFLVASAVRASRASERLGPKSARASLFGTERAARQEVLDPSSMLVHPSALKESHFDVARQIHEWSAGDSGDDRDQKVDGIRPLGIAGIVADMHTNARRWLFWMDEYSRGAAKSREVLQLQAERLFPTDWHRLQAIILEEIVPATTIAVINSDPAADDRPDFAPRKTGDDWAPAKNLSTIFVSGNVMSRGLTLEGLLTTVFSRSSNAPLADTQMQMQRWFGYRGSYIELCRVFLTPHQLELFSSYHDADEALRRDVLSQMREGETASAVTVLQGRGYSATGKISTIRGVPLFPGARPFVRHMNSVEHDTQNLSVVARCFAEETSVIEGRRGLLMRESLSLLETASLLDELQYLDHGTWPGDPEADRWGSVGRHARLDPDDPESPLFRAPVVSDSVDLGIRSPYSIAAYLRLWSACLDRRVAGLSTSEEVPVRWGIVDLDEKTRQQPRFRVGLRFGSGTPVTSGPLSDLPFTVRPMVRSLTSTNELSGSWGSRNEGDTGIGGDELFDYRLLGEVPRLTVGGGREPGEDGLLLFHVIERGQGQGTIALGMSIPLGGPDHVEARR